jgi:glyoxylase-like metal-dependent hydrolase (beta-lactamase superfamily II)
MPRIVPVDCHYRDRPRFAAAYLVIEGDRAAFVDNNTVHAVPRLLDALEAEGVEPAHVDYLVVTHVHLDHAGGTAALAEACPQATILAHPKAAPHLVDPAKLVAGATAVYGEELFARLYGRVDPVPEARVRTVEDGESVGFAGREWAVLHTAGHADHHVCLHDPRAGAVFAGDALGLCYPELQAHGTVALPSTSPTGFRPVEARAAVDRILALEPRTVHLGHYGTLDAARLPEVARQLHAHLHFAQELAEAAEASELPDDELEAWVHPRLVDYVRGWLDGLGPLGRDPGVWELLSMDLALNAQGIAFAAKKARFKAGRSAPS